MIRCLCGGQLTDVVTAIGGDTARVIVFRCGTCEHLMRVQLQMRDIGAPSKPSVGFCGRAGESNHAAKLTREQVEQIRERRRNGERGTVLAREFGVSPNTVVHAVKGRTWGGAA